MYSEDETILAVLKFHQRVILQSYLPSCALILPPPTGWPTISEPNSSENPTVFSLLHQLPYLRSEKSSERICVDWQTIAINYSSDECTSGSFAEDVYPLPNYCVYRTRSVGREGIALILDTNEVIITCMGSGSRIQLCIGDESKRYQDRIGSFYRPAKMMDYVERKHLKGKDPKARIECCCLTCKSQGLILEHLQHFKNHAQAVHGSMLRDPRFVR